MKLPNIKAISFSLPNLPKLVLVSIVAVTSALVLFGVLFFTLGEAKDRAEAETAKLKSELSSIQTKLKQSKDDYDFVLKNQTRFEELMASDKLIPHTRRTAIREMQALALEFGVTNLNYNFQASGLQSADAASAQAKATDYRVYIENIELSVGAALDQSIYSFLAAAYDKFPGSIVVSSIELNRAPTVTTEMLNMVSRGEDSKIVQGKIKYVWRTAQKQEAKK